MRMLSKRVALLASTAALAVPGVIVSGTAAHADTNTTLIRVFGSTHCLDNATENSTKLQMWDCTGHAEQNWSPVFNGTTQNFAFKNENTGLCITAPGSGGGTVVMAGCGGASTQQWTLIYENTPSQQVDGAYSVWESASAPGWCLNTNSVGNGTAIRTWPCDITDHYQKWHFDN